MRHDGEDTIANLVEQQRKFFATGATRPLAVRREYLSRLAKIIRRMEPDILEALRQDLGKSGTEGYMTEIGMVLGEIRYMIGHLRTFAGKRYRPTPLAQMPGKSYELAVPYGTVLILSPWNYPFLLSMEPLIDALAAGNTAVVKVSASATATGRVIARLLNSVFPRDYVAVVQGGREENQQLLAQKFDFIFFTGSKPVGRHVMAQAARTLTPVCLELGGKSPCIVDETADLRRAAVRIAFGKFLNAGQTCVAPDYVLVQNSVKEEFLLLLAEAIDSQYGGDALENPHYGAIVNEKHLKRLTQLADPAKIVYGGRVKGLRMEPTVMDGVTLSDAVMQEEIFGPLLPLVPYETMEEAEAIIAANPQPLALYLFTRDAKVKERVMTDILFGGGCVNDTIVHLATSHMGFGGVGESGMGSYHGRRGFETFSHVKSIVEKPSRLELPLRYQPYTPLKDKVIHWFMR